MIPGQDPTPDNIPEIRKTAIIDRELLRLRVDIAGLQETRLSDEGSLREENYTFFWKGRHESQRRDYGVGFAVHNKLLACMEPPTYTSERLMSMRLITSTGPVTLVSAYAPTLASKSDVIDSFYDELRLLMESIRSSDKIIVLGDFNARIGSNSTDWSDCIGAHGIGNMNDNGQRLLEFCTSHGLCATNTFFQNKVAHKVSWRHPRSGHWHQIDFVLYRRRDLRDIHNTRTYHSAICDTDHSLVLSKMKLLPQKIYSERPRRKLRAPLDITGLSDVATRSQFSAVVQGKLSVETLQGSQSLESAWTNFRDTVMKTAEETLGRKVRKQTDWFAEYEQVLHPLIEEKRSAYTDYLNNPSDAHCEIRYKRAKANLQRISRECANSYWTKLCMKIQQCHDVGNYRGMYQNIKVAIGPTIRKRAAIKDLNGEPIADKNQQLERWAQHYTDLYAEPISISASALESLEVFPVALDLDEKPSFEELHKAILGLKLGKSVGRDEIPAELLRTGYVSSLLFVLILRCWDEKAIPKDMRDANIVTLYKGKGDRGDCNNYRGISLLSIAGKAFAKVVLKRLESLADRVYPETQCGFRAGRSTTDMIFTLRQVQEKCREQRMPLFTAFVDLQKAFDTVSRQGLYRVLEHIGCPPTLLAIIKSFHDGMCGTVFDGEESGPFNVNRGVRQGCVLASTLFGIFFSVLLLVAFKNCDVGVHLHTRKDGRLFNINLLRSKRNRLDLLARELLYADDAALVANTEGDLQELITKFNSACKLFGMTVNSRKTVVMVQGTDYMPQIMLGEDTLQIVDDFCYLGSTTTNKLCNNKEINTRIGRAATNFGKLHARVWRNNKLNISTKVLVYKTCVLSILLYASETWTTYSMHERRLNAFHMRCLRAILDVTWKDRMSNERVLDITRTCSITATLKQRRLRWLGHVLRMDPDRLPRAVMLGQIADAKRPVGRPMLRFKDSCKRDMLSFGINPNTWETAAIARAEWRGLLYDGLAHHDEAWLDGLRQKRLRAVQEPSADSRYTCDLCGRRCRAAIGLYSHRKRCAQTSSHRMD
ncbi:unnamed protein product [Plutella xylostella]|uniref:(diamondback moth) hypothetical protein n=1 Tax=Plutella xylostella TaxID=51655 RepID=A0A8S4FLH8_PLUXY|nr:unnamed protein product [Plutella xylostella]